MKRKSLLKIRIVAHIFIIPLFLMLLWNYTMPTFELPEINYLQAFAMKMICSVLFKKNETLINDFKELDKNTEEKLL